MAIDMLDTYRRKPYTVTELEAMDEPLAKFVQVNCYSHQIGNYVNTFDEIGYTLFAYFGWVGGDGAPAFTIIFERTAGRERC